MPADYRARAPLPGSAGGAPVTCYVCAKKVRFFVTAQLAADMLASHRSQPTADGEGDPIDYLLVASADNPERAILSRLELLLDDSLPWVYTRFMPEEV